MVQLLIYSIGLTDLQKNSYLFKQTVQLRRKKNIGADSNKVTFGPFTTLSKEEKQLLLNMTTIDFDLDVILQKGKGAFWHCDNGVLAMGLPNDPKQRTVYYSFTNMPSEGKLTIKDNTGQSRVIEVVEKS